MSDVFISYSRQNSKFVQTLSTAFVNANRVAWVDWQNIARGDDWWREIELGIENAEVFLCVVSEPWLRSEICHRELAHARKKNKRVFPLILEQIVDDIELRIKGTWMDQNHEQLARDNWDYIRHLNWIFFDEKEKFSVEFTALLQALDEDQSHIKAHTRYQIRSLEWKRNSKNSSFLLLGDDLIFAEKWLEQTISENKSPKPTEEQIAYIQKSRNVEERRQSTLKRLRLFSWIFGITFVLATISALTLGGLLNSERERANLAIELQLQVELNATQEGLIISQRATQDAISLAERNDASRDDVNVSNGNPSEIVAQIIQRGFVRCGVNFALPSFGEQINGEMVGFDIDICRAVAASITGDSNSVEFIELTSSERALALEFGQVDMISRNTTITLLRNTEWNATFGPTVFYDGQGIMVGSEFNSLESLDGETICVAVGTTNQSNLIQKMAELDLTLTIVPHSDTRFAFEAFDNGECVAITADITALAAFRANSERSDIYRILDVFLSKEPLAPLSPDSDPNFANIIRWVVWGLVESEELGITSNNIDTFVDSNDARVYQLLGTQGNTVGAYLGIRNNFMYQVISQVGNYGEIYERNLGQDGLGLSRGLNALWTDGGLMYSPPFR